MLNLITSKPQLKVVFDQVGTLTYALDLANAIMIIIEDYIKESLTLNTEPYTKNGIFHLSNEGVCSWFDFTKLIAEIAGNINASSNRAIRTNFRLQ